MLFILLTFLAALSLAAVSGWFSIVGFMAIYAGAPMYALIMGVVVECAKLVTTSWLYRNSKTSSWKLKAPLYYFTIALMAATSIGVFGFLSKAHLEQGAGTIDNGPKIERLNYQIEREKSIIADNEKVIKQLDDTVNSFLGKDRTDRSLAVRKSQAPQRKQLREDIDASQKRIDQLSEEKLKLDSEVRKMQLEVGPIRYIAELVYGVQEDSGKNVEAAVRMFTLLIVSTLDPLAIALLIAANHSLAQWKRKDEKEISLSTDSVESETLGNQILPEEGNALPGEFTGEHNAATQPASSQITEDAVSHETKTEDQGTGSLEISSNDEIGVQTILSGAETLVVSLPLQENSSEPVIEETKDITTEDLSTREPFFEDRLPTLASETKATSLEELVEAVEPAAEQPSSGLEGKISDTEIPEESILVVLKPSWDLEESDNLFDAIPDPVITKKEVKPWAQQDSVLRELLGPHFQPTRVNEKEKDTSDSEGKATSRDSQTQEEAGLQILQPTEQATTNDQEVQEVSPETSLQDQDAEVLQITTNRVGSEASDKYPKALSWLTEFKRS